MNQYRKIALLWVLLLAICATLMVSCINPDAGEFYTTDSPTTTAKPEITASTTPEETIPEQITPEATTPEQTTPEEMPPEETSPADLFIPYTVTVVDGNNAPLSNAIVQLCVGDWYKIPVLTNAKGVVTIMANKDNYTVKVTLSGYTGKAEYRFAEGATELTVQLIKINAVTTPKVTTPEATTPVETTPEETTPEETTPEETTPTGKIKIYIDQGHNPHSWNTGAQGNGLKEEDLTFEIGILLSELLLQDDRFEVRLSRPTAETVLGTDNNSALDFRVNDAREWGADYFISLHINASEDYPTATGLEVYTATADTVGYEIGDSILKELVKTTGLRDRGMKNGDKLRVLKNAKMPAALIEMGFITNESDASLLRDSSELFVQGLYDGILSYFDDL